MKPINITPKNPDSKFIALDIKDQSKIIAEGKTINIVIDKAEKTGKKFILAPVLKENCTYIF
jgi:hypothetical protein